FDYNNKKVLLRLDINSPIDIESKKITNENRIKKSIPTIKYLLDKNAKVALIAHQGDTLDYQNLISLKEHSLKLSEYLEKDVKYIDDVAGGFAINEIKNLEAGQCILLGNLRYLTEEISTFENSVKLTPEKMQECYLVRRYQGLFDFYVNDAFSAAHRNAPSMVAFQNTLPSAAGYLFVDEVSNLNKIISNPDKPCVFVLGGAKISDAFGMINQVLSNETADNILTTGITGEIFLIASGYDIGETKRKFLENRNLLGFVNDAKEYLNNYPDKIEFPKDLGFKKDNKRCEIEINKLPQNEMFMDIGSKTLKAYEEIINSANTIFVNGPAGVYEEKMFEKGTKRLWKVISKAKGYSVIGGGDTVSAASQYINLEDINYVCTAGGAMVRYLSGKKLPLIEAMENAYIQNKE
ncbi:MAG: phosphoglycerate kinase, partial [Bacillota bacterium]|nr:phosphoglycerate kinase [Bacillota bacterium]